MLTDYSSMTAERALGVVKNAIAEGDALVASILAAEGPRTYANTLAPLDRALVAVNDAYGVGGFMANVHPDEAVRASAAAAEELQQKWLSDLAFNRALYLAVQDYAATEDGAGLTGEHRRNLDFWLRDFRRAGQELPDEERAEVQRLRRRLIELQVAFDRNLNEWEDGLDATREELAGLPDDFVARLDPGEADGTYRVTVAYPDYVPVMQDGANRDLRRRLQHKFLNRAAEANVPLLDEAVELRWQISTRLGYPTFAEYAMEPRMADPPAVEEFYGSLIPGLTEAGKRELAALQELMDADHPGESLQQWDWMFYDTQQRKADYGVDDHEVAAYFPLEAVVDGMFAICGDMFGIDFVPVDEPKAWHPDVDVYEIRERSTGDLVAHYYADLHPRPGKYSHAACWRLRAGYLSDGGYRRPVAAVAANFTKPTADTPSLLKHDEAVTLFHEFGHVLHNALTLVELPRFSGTQTERDFVEAPSQIMENWMWEPEVLQRFARHHRTGEPIPTGLVERMVAARNQNVALKTLRQVFYGRFDLALHGGAGPLGADDAHAATAGLTLVPPHPGTRFAASFGHMMSDGYVAGYYGYLWSEVYGDDMFSVFTEAGVLDPDIGRRYREAILARGGTVDGADLLRDFLGRDPSPDAFLRKVGLGA